MDDVIFEEFKGALTENYILQMLLSSGVKPNYFTFDNKYEIDYIMQYKNNIIPIEVKSNENVNSVSLKHYNEKYNPKIKIRFSMKNLPWSSPRGESYLALGRLAPYLERACIRP